MDQALLQAYRARMVPQGAKRDSDAEFLNENIYATDPAGPTEMEPRGLLDRLYRERYSNQPARPYMADQLNTVPTTKRTY